MLTSQIDGFISVISASYSRLATHYLLTRRIMAVDFSLVFRRSWLGKELPLSQRLVHVDSELLTSHLASLYLSLDLGYEPTIDYMGQVCLSYSLRLLR